MNITSIMNFSLVQKAALRFAADTGLVAKALCSMSVKPDLKVNAHLFNCLKKTCTGKPQLV